jgi:rod shape determining protein RodA
LANFDWVLLAAVLILSLSGIMTIFSATRPLPGEPHPSFYIKQIYWLLIGVAAMAAVVVMDYKGLRRASYFIYGGCLLLLVAVFIGGRAGMGAQRWLAIGPISFQPSEFFKLALIIAFARFMSMKKGRMGAGGICLAFLAFMLLPLMLVLKQPDLGTAVVLLFIFAVLALAKGVQRKVVVLALVIALLSVPFMGNILWNKLKGYQKDRIVAFINPEADPGGAGYHIVQSKVAVGSGGAFGKGYLKGTQGPFRFLPEKHTDFIFSIFAEEWGFAGSLLLLLLYLIIIMRGLGTAENAKDEFGRLLALGITLMFAFYSVVNIGMTLGLMPVVGIPLPFMSYGGTALVSNMIAAGLLINIRARRFELSF